MRASSPVISAAITATARSFTSADHAGAAVSAAGAAAGGSWPPFLASTWAGCRSAGAAFLTSVCARPPAGSSNRPAHAQAHKPHRQPRRKPRAAIAIRALAAVPARTPFRDLNCCLPNRCPRSRRRSAMAPPAKLSCHRGGGGLKIPSLTAVSVFRRRSPRRANGPGAVSSPPKPHARTKEPARRRCDGSFLRERSAIACSLR